MSANGIEASNSTAIRTPIQLISAVRAVTGTQGFL
jgi:hypothetical protein